MLYVWPILFTLEWKTNSHLVFWYKKKIEKDWRVIVPCGYFIGIFRIRSSSISAYSLRLKDNNSSSESKKPFVIYTLSIYYGSSTEDRGVAGIFAEVRTIFQIPLQHLRFHEVVFWVCLVQIPDNFKLNSPGMNRF